MAEPLEQTQEGIALGPITMSRGRLVFYIATLAGILLVYFKLDELRGIRDLFFRADPWWLLLIVVSQWFSYHFWALTYQDILRIKGLQLSTSELFPMVLIVQFINKVLPSANVSGQAFFIHYLRRFNVSIADGIGRAVLELMMLYMAFGTFFIVSIVIMARQGILERHPHIWIIVGLFGFIAVVFILIFLVIQRRGKSALLAWVSSRFARIFRDSKISRHAHHISMIIAQFKENLAIRDLRKHGRLFWRSYAWQILYLLMNVVTFYASARALGLNISIFAAFVVFSITQFIAMLAFIPGALGIFEFIMTLLLVAYGFPAGSSLGVTLLARTFTFWLPLLIGWWLYRQYLKREEKQRIAA